MDVCFEREKNDLYQVSISSLYISPHFQFIANLPPFLHLIHDDILLYIAVHYRNVDYLSSSIPANFIQ
jgi:hypothetical protein